MRWDVPTAMLVAVLAAWAGAAPPPAWAAEDGPGAANGSSGADARGNPPKSREDGRIDVETILSTPLDPSEYQEATRCISSRDYRRIEVLDEFNVLFVGRRQTWLNRLRTRCAGLEPDMIIYVSQSSSRVCTHDHFRGAERGGFGIPTPMCVLGDFERIDEGQVEGLRGAIMSEREAARRGDAAASAGDEG